MSTYITALIAGPYHFVTDTYKGEKEVPLGIYCRTSLAPKLDADEIFKITLGSTATICDNDVFGIANHRNFAQYFDTAIFVVALFRFCFFAATFYKCVQLLLI